MHELRKCALGAEYPDTLTTRSANNLAASMAASLSDSDQGKLNCKAILNYVELGTLGSEPNVRVLTLIP